MVMVMMMMMMMTMTRMMLLLMMVVMTRKTVKVVMTELECDDQVVTGDLDEQAAAEMLNDDGDGDGD